MEEQTSPIWEQIAEAVRLQSSDLRRALEIAEAAYAEAPSTRDAALVARATYILGSLLRISGISYPRSKDLLLQALNLYEALGIAPVGVHIQLGQLFVEQGEHALSRTHLNLALTCWGVNDPPKQRADILLNLGNATALEDPDASHRLYQEALQIYSEEDHEDGIAIALANHGAHLQLKGRHKDAISSLAESAIIFLSVNDERSRGIVMHKLATSHLALGDMPSASSCNATALDISDREQLLSLRVHALRTQADIFKQMSEPEQASMVLEEADALAKVIGFLP